MNSYPTVLLLTPDGTLMSRLVSQSPDDFVREVTPLLNGPHSPRERAVPLGADRRESEGAGRDVKLYAQLALMNTDGALVTAKALEGFAGACGERAG